MPAPADRFAPVFELINGMRLTTQERDRLETRFRDAMQAHGWDEYQRGRAAGIQESARAEQRTTDEIRRELLDTVAAALGIDSD